MFEGTVPSERGEVEWFSTFDKHNLVLLIWKTKTRPPTPVLSNEGKECHVVFLRHGHFLPISTSMKERKKLASTTYQRSKCRKNMENYR